MNRGFKIAALLLSTGVCASCTSRMAMRTGPDGHISDTAPRQPAKLAQVDLFSRGVGVFQYQGLVHGTQKQTLSFRSGQINDVLASLVFQDTGGGQAGEVTFPAATPLSVTLRGFLLDINNNPSRRELLQQLRGVSVTLTLKKPRNCKLTGRIIDLLHRGFFMPPLRPGAPVVRYNNGPAIIAGSGWYLNLLSHAKLKQVSLHNVSAIRINNRRLRESLNKALDALANQPNKHKRRMTLWFKGRATRLIRFAYLLETPLWRMTYRLILPAPAKDTSAATHTGKHADAVLQAMVIVANQTDMNWSHVQLDIRGGEPLSFIKNLYQPLYVRRPVEPQPADTYDTPQTYGQGVTPSPYAAKAMVERSEMFAGGGGGFAGLAAQNAAQAMPMMAMKRQFSAPFNPLQGVNAMASAGVVHPAFDYHVKDVTVPREQSAMVPILVTPIKAQQLDLYSVGQASGNPFFAARVTNNTRKFLPPGTLTVYTSSIYDGEARLDALPPGMHHIHTFAVDQSTTVRLTQTTQHTALEAAALHDGTLALKNRILINTFYKLDNTAAHARDVLVRTSIDKHWKILLPAAGVTLHNGMYECMQAVQPNGIAVLHIRQQQSRMDNVYLPGMDIAALRTTLKTVHLPANISAAINQAISLLKLVNAKQAALNRNSEKIQQAQDDETRLRKNLRAMNKTAPAYNQMANELVLVETQLIALQKQSLLLRHQAGDAQKAVNTYWSHANVPQTVAK